MSAPALLPLLLLHAVSVEPARFEARGERHEALLRLDDAAMVRIAADDPSGTSCTLVDHLRGPFADSGTAGVENCRTDLLLDSGQYQVRLRSAPKRNAPFRLTATQFRELNPEPRKLEPGGGAELPLRSGEQASFWIHVHERGPVTFRASGRTAGRIEVWRDGAWRMDLRPNHQLVEPTPGQPLHEWWLEQVFEPGAYRVTVYGTAELQWTRGKPHDVLSVALGFASAPEPRTSTVTLPAWGLFALALPKHPVVATLSLDEAGAQNTSLQLFTVGTDGGTNIGGGGAVGTCIVAPKALIPQCAASSGADGRHVLLIRGAPGTKVALQWAPRARGLDVVSGTYAVGPQGSFGFTVPESGEHLIAVHDVPVDVDAAPQGCVLERGEVTRDALRPGAEFVRWIQVQADTLQLDRRRAFRRAFNHDGRQSRIAFTVTERGAYRLQTSGDRNGRCELFKGLGANATRRGATQDSPGRCDQTEVLEPGTYEWVLYGGTPGIERVRIAHERNLEGPDTATKTSCLLSGVKLQAGTRYRVVLSRGGDVSARGFYAARIPLTVAEPFALVLDADQRLNLPLAPGPRIHAQSMSTLRCEGGCTVAARTTGGRLVLHNGGEGPAPVLLHRDQPMPALGAPMAFTPRLPELQQIVPGRPVHLDFERQQQHALRFDVAQPGLYHVRTSGLLATRCELRTPVVASLGADTSGGRGRNCLVAQYLRPGRYLLTARTVGPSRGRAGIEIERRPVTDAAAVGTQDPTFFRAGAGDLVRQRVDVPREGSWRIATSAPGARLMCRLETSEGWPVVPVPTPCDGAYELAKETYGWLQLPLTVESTRRTSLEEVRAAPVLEGELEHAITLNADYTARLGADGQDAFVFEVPAAHEISVSLNNGMQGRLFRLGQGAPVPIELIPPDVGAFRAKLERGRHRLVTEHSRADVAVTYGLRLETTVLVPGIALDVRTPREVPLRVAEPAVYGIQTDGGTDVRCRLRDANGRVLSESASRGANWNCAFAEPLSPGDYAVEITSETLVPGTTRVSASVLPVKPGGALGRTVQLGEELRVFELPSADDQVVRELRLQAAQPFSCAVLAPDGEEIFRQTETTRCAALLRLAAGRPMLRLWTLSREVEVDVEHALRPIGSAQRGRIPEGGAVRAELTRSGRYETGEGVFCLPEAKRGVLQPCEDAVSLEAGAVVFSHFGAKGTAELPLKEQVAEVLPDAGFEGTTLSSRTFIQRERAKQSAVHVMDMRVAPGESATPSCSFDAGRRRMEGTRCTAATAPREEAVVRWSLPVDTPVQAQVQRTVLPWPEESQALVPGVHTLSWSGGPLRLGLPAKPARVDLIAPAHAWIVQFDGSGAAVDLCPPEETLARCVLEAHGGTLLVHAPGEQRLDTQVILLDQPAKRIALIGLYEAIPRTPGRLVLQVAPGAKVRTLEVEGASRCVFIASDGRRQSTCRLRLPVGATGELLVDHEAAPLRALLFGEEPRDQVLFAKPSTKGLPPLSEATTLRLPGAAVARVITLDREAGVQLRSDSGVCGLWPLEDSRPSALEGLGSGCDISRVLSAGTWVVGVRAFAGLPPAGELYWTRSPVEPLEEGVGPERWIAPDTSRFFRFEVASPTQVGLGLQVSAEALTCTLRDATGRVLGTGCHQYLALEPGAHVLEVHAPPSTTALPFRPVLFGLSGPHVGVPDDYLRDFFQRIGVSR